MHFDEIIGQQEAQDRLQQLLDEHRIPHALLVTGPEGCGKMALAMAFARFLLSDGNSDIATDEARLRNAHAMLAKWEHPDLHFTYPTIKKSSWPSDHKPVSDDFTKEWHQMIAKDVYFTMEEWMTAMGAENQQAIITAEESDAIAHKLSLKSSMGGVKISLIWLPERMNQQAANKILKLLEEPPQQTFFLMVSEHPEQLLETIRSRTQVFRMKRIDTEDIEKALVEKRGIAASDAHRIARVANGNWLKALEELNVGNENVLFLDMFIMLMRRAYMRDIHDLKKWADVIATYGREKQKRLLTYFLRMVRENFMYNFGNPDLVYMTEKEEKFSVNFARFINEANVIEISMLLQNALRDIGQNANAKVVFFDLALNMIVLLIRK